MRKKSTDYKVVDFFLFPSCDGEEKGNSLYSISTEKGSKRNEDWNCRKWNDCKADTSGYKKNPGY